MHGLTTELLIQTQCQTFDRFNWYSTHNEKFDFTDQSRQWSKHISVLPNPNLLDVFMQPNLVHVNKTLKTNG